MGNNNPSDFTDFQVGDYAVCLIDILGQKAKLEEWDKLPKSDKPTKELIGILKKTVGVVLDFKDMFKKFFEVFEQAGMPALQLASLPEDMQQYYTRYKDCKLDVQQFSDTFVFYAPLVNSHRDWTPLPLFRMLVASASAMLCSLAAGVPVRGAITIGQGTELAPQNFYGPALAKAHFIEKETAKHPRIVVSKEAVKYISSPGGFSDNNHIEQVMLDIATLTHSLTCTDTDGNKIVDFMGQGMKEILDSSAIQFAEAIEKAYNFVGDEALRFRQKGDEKHADRYLLLQKYMEARLAIWDLSHLKGASHGE